MLVSREALEETLGLLSKKAWLAVDTETTGLRPYHGDKLFSIIIATDTEEYYFDFGANLQSLPRELLFKFSGLFSTPNILWFAHNAKFDLHFLAKENLHIAGLIHCTMAMHRLVNSEMLSYSLDKCVKHALNQEKDDGVMRYIKEHALWTKVAIPGKAQLSKNLHFDQVPLEIMQPYAEKDARLTYDLGVWQLEQLGKTDAKALEHWPKVGKVYRNERNLTKTLLTMESRGVLINRDYAQQASDYYHQKISEVEQDFAALTGKEFVDSGKAFAEIYPADKLIYGEPTATGKVNPSFDSEVLASWDDPVSKLILTHRNCKKQKEFFDGLLYAADKDNVVHTNFRQSGTATGRMSCSDPNIQQWPGEDDTQEFSVRRAIIPRPGYFFCMMDYEQMEFKFILELANAKGLIPKVLGGLDVHQVTADQAGIDRAQAKAGNFANIYGSGLAKFAETIGTTEDKAKIIRQSIYDAAPEIKAFIDSAKLEAENRGYTINWAGRRCLFLDPKRFSYKATNYLVQGGTADIIKIAIVQIARFLADKMSAMLLVIHDEILFEIHKDEAHIVLELKRLMESAYKHKHLPMTVSVEYSATSFADKSPSVPSLQ